MPAEFLLATRSRHKALEIQQLLHHSARVLTLQEAGVTESAAEEGIEVFDTFRENACAKARYFRAITALPVIADDSGIVLDALGGAPGVRSRRFSGRTDLDGAALDRANNALAVERLRSVPTPERSAHYVCAAVVAFTDGVVSTAVGACTGQFLLEPRGAGGFGYDPHFLIPEIQQTFAEITAVEKHRYSHRARAFRALIPLLRT
jgi:XTP/dITP diphosphohydrolase